MSRSNACVRGRDRILAGSALGWRILVAFAACLLASAALAQNYPSKAMRLIVRAPPGGTDDLIARLIAPAIGKTAGQQVIVDYRPGAGGLVAWEYIAKQPPDGHTMLLAASGLAAIRSLRQGVTLDPFKDIGWVTQVTDFMLVLLVHPALPARDVKVNTPDAMLQMARKEADLIADIVRTAGIKPE